MKKSFVLTVLIVVSLVGCAGDKSPIGGLPTKLPPRQVNIQKEIKTATNLSKGSILVPTNDYEMSYKYLSPSFVNELAVFKQKTPAKQEDYLFEAWEPKPLQEKTALSKLWALDLDEFYIKKYKEKYGSQKLIENYMRFGDANYETFPDGWYIDHLDIRGVYNPSNGKKIEGLHGGVGIAEAHSDYIFGAPYDLDDEIQKLEKANNWVSPFYLCWDKKTQEIRYRTGFMMKKEKKYFVHNGAIYFNDYYLRKHDAWTGNLEWAINFKSPESSEYEQQVMVPYYWQSSNKYMWLVQSTNDYQKDVCLYRLEPETLELMKVNFNLVGGVFVKGDRVYIIHDWFSKITVINEDGVPLETKEMPKEISEQFKEDKLVLKKYALALAMPFGSKMIFGYSDKSNLMFTRNAGPRYKPFVFDPTGKSKPVPLSEGIKPTDFKQVYPFLLWRDFYIEDDKNFYGFDIESGQKTWNIPKSELGPNPAISISDWRGVLVKDDNQMTAWGVK